MNCGAGATSSPRWVGLALSLLAAGCAMADDDNKRYVESIAATCTFDDGYVCIEPGEDDFLSRESESKLVPAVHVYAFSAAHEHFQSLAFLNDAQKHLKHYKIGFTEDADHYIVLFRALLMPNIVANQPTGVATASFGITTKMWVDKHTNKVVKHLFYR